MPSHRRKASPANRIAAAAAVILVALAGVTVLAVHRSEEPAAQVAADSTGATASDSASPSPATSAAEEPAGQRTRVGTSAKERTQAPSADTLPRSVCQPQRVDEQVTVLTYNIMAGHHGLTRVLSAISAADADVVLLQEVDRFRARSGNVDMPTYLAQRLDMNAAFGANVSVGGRSQYGTAILSRYPIEEEWNALLPNPRGGEQRGLLHVVLNVKGLRLSVYGTHLDQDNQHAQVQQMSAIKSVLVKDPMPKLLGGDLSSQPDSPVLRIALTVLDDAWAAGVGVGSPLTWPAAHPRGRSDYLLHRGVALEPLRADVLSARASDHRAVRTSYRLTGNAGSVCEDEPRTGKRR